jgi:hypothetical protein
VVADRQSSSLMTPPRRRLLLSIREWLLLLAVIGLSVGWYRDRAAMGRERMANSAKKLGAAAASPVEVELQEKQLEVARLQKLLADCAHPEDTPATEATTANPVPLEVDRGMFPGPKRQIKKRMDSR